MSGVPVTNYVRSGDVCIAWATQIPPLQTLVDDLVLVMDETRSRSAAIFSPNFDAPLASMFAAAHPERTESIVAIDSFARFLVGDGYPRGTQCPARRARGSGLLVVLHGR